MEGGKRRCCVQYFRWSFCISGGRRVISGCVCLYVSLAPSNWSNASDIYNRPHTALLAVHEAEQKTKQEAIEALEQKVHTLQNERDADKKAHKEALDKVLLNVLRLHQLLTLLRVDFN